MAGVREALLIHGAGGGGWEWRIWQTVLERHGIRAHAPDLAPARGGVAATRLADYRDQLEARVSAGAALVGASLGGLLALMLAPRVRANAIVLVNPLPPVGTPGWAPAREFAPIVEWCDRGLESTRDAMPEAEDSWVQWAHARWRPESGAVLEAAYQGIEIESSRLPTIVFTGADDDEVPPDAQRALARRLGADFMEMPGVSHLGILLGRRAGTAAGLVATWLSRIDAS